MAIMTIQITGQTLTVEASGDLSGDQYKFMRIDGNGRAVRASTGQSVIGVLQNKPSGLGQAATIWGPGSISKVIAGAPLAPNRNVAPDANGSAQVSVNSFHFLAGTTISDGVSGGPVSVLIHNPGRVQE